VRKIVKVVLHGQLYVFLVAALAALIMLGIGYRQETGPLVIVAFACLALYSMGHVFLRRIAFTIWVFASVAASMFYPEAFDVWFHGTRLEIDLEKLIVPLIQIITFGMGSTLSVKDFTRVFLMPWPVFVGTALQFGVMPFVGYCIAKLFGFEPEVAAGVILIGSVPGGVASNLITYLARANVALSVTMTACSTLMSPLMTPFMMKLLAGRLVPIKFYAMMISILNMIIVPIVAGLVANKILYGRAKWNKQIGPLALIGAVGLVGALLAATLLKSDTRRSPAPGEKNPQVESAPAEEDSPEPSPPAAEKSPGPLVQLKSGIIIGFLLVGLVALAKLGVIVCKGPENWMDRVLPIVSMAGICLIIAIITATARNDLLKVGVALIGAAILHNSTGYLLGYWGARLLRLDQTACRTVAIEVGLQNGGMASGLAITVLKSAKAAMAPAIFGPWMNVSGSILATWWHSRPVRDGSAVEKVHDSTP
jgi:BASS family bile acid:Na+ symporter